MQALLFPFMLLSALGLALSTYAHVLAVLGSPPVWGESVWFLHAGIFVVWLPAVLVSQRVMRDVPQKDFWKVVLLGCPGWMKKLLMAGFFYAIANFLYFTYASGLGKSVENDDSSEIRGFSGHWLIFYGAAFAILYSVRRRPDLLQQRKCPAGHPVSHDAEYCSNCGVRLGTGSRGAT